MREILGGVQAGLAHSGAIDILTFQKASTFWSQSTAGIVEGRPHDIVDVRD